MSNARRFASHTALALAEAGLIALLVVGLIAGTAFAGRPSRSSATLTADCPCVASDPILFTGSGYDPSRALAMLSFNGATTSTAVEADGTIDHLWPYFDEPGRYWVRAYQAGKGGKMILKAETWVTVD